MTSLDFASLDFLQPDTNAATLANDLGSWLEANDEIVGGIHNATYDQFSSFHYLPGTDFTTFHSNYHGVPFSSNAVSTSEWCTLSPSELMTGDGAQEGNQPELDSGAFPTQ